MAELKKRRGTRESLPVVNIIADPQLQMRPEGSDAKHVQRVRDAIKGKEEIPDIYVCRVRGDDRPGDYVIDGFQRLEAHIAEEKKTIGALVFTVDQFAEAILLAAPANADQKASPRTTESKRRAVESTVKGLSGMLLKWSNRQIAEHCSVSHALVGEVLKELRDRQDIADADASAKARGKDGREREPKHQSPKGAPTPSTDGTWRRITPSSGGTWRQMPLDEGFNASHADLDKFRQARLKTVGDLFDKIVGGGVPGVSGHNAAECMDKIKRMEGFDGVFPVEEMEVYDWKGFEADWGKVARRLNEIGLAGGDVRLMDATHIKLSEAYSSYLAVRDSIKAAAEEQANGEGEN